MSYIRMDKALTRKPKFRRIARETGMEDALIVGYLHAIWSVVDELGQDFEGTDEDIACAVCAPSALLCALCAVGWADRFDGGITFHSNDPIAESRTEAHRARAKRSYERKMASLRAESAPLCASAPPPSLPLPPHLSPLTSPTSSPVAQKSADKNIEQAIAQHAGPNASLIFTLSRDPIVMRVWNATSKRWAKERGKNLPKLAAAIQMEQDERGITREQAAELLQRAIAAYVASPEGQGQYKRSMARWLDVEGWREDPSSWQDHANDKQAKIVDRTAAASRAAWGLPPEDTDQ
jgi:hypothetical protein